MAKEKIRKSNTMKLIETLFASDLEELLKKDYMDDGMNIDDMAKKYNISPLTVHRWLVRFDIPRRHLKFTY